MDQPLKLQVDQCLDQRQPRLQVCQDLDHPKCLAVADQYSVPPLLPLQVHRCLDQHPPRLMDQCLVARQLNLAQCLEDQVVAASWED